MSAIAIDDRVIHLEVADNVRHIGGYRTGDGRVTSDAVIRAGSLHRPLKETWRRSVPAALRPSSTCGPKTSWCASQVPTSAERGLATCTPHPDRRVSRSAARGAGHLHRDAGSRDHRSPTLLEAVVGTDGAVLSHCSAGKDRTA